jgi:hypothetical protein
MVLLPMTFEARLQNYCKRKSLIMNKKNIISTKRTSSSPPCNWRKELKKESRNCREEDTCGKRLTPKYLSHRYEVAAHISDCTRTNSTRHNHLGK